MTPTQVFLLYVLLIGIILHFMFMAYLRNRAFGRTKWSHRILAESNISFRFSQLIAINPIKVKWGSITAFVGQYLFFFYLNSRLFFLSLLFLCFYFLWFFFVCFYINFVEIILLCWNRKQRSFEFQSKKYVILWKSHKIEVQMKCQS